MTLEGLIIAICAVSIVAYCIWSIKVNGGIDI